MGKCSSANKSKGKVVIKEFDEVDKTNVEYLSTHQKANYGEWSTNQKLEGKKFDIIHNGEKKEIELGKMRNINFSNSPDNINAKIQKGIDHIYDVKNPPPDIIVVESKFGSSRLGKTADGRQMSKKWIESRLDSLGLEGKEYKSYISRIDKAGKVTVKELNNEGYIIRGSVLNNK